MNYDEEISGSLFCTESAIETFVTEIFFALETKLARSACEIAKTFCSFIQFNCNYH